MAMTGSPEQCVLIHLWTPLNSFALLATISCLVKLKMHVAHTVLQVKGYYPHRQ